MLNSGIQAGDRIAWVDGEFIHSLNQLSHNINDNRAFLTIERNHERIFMRVPRIPLQELKVEPLVKDEYIDWQYEAQLNNIKTTNLLVIPYNLNSAGIVEGELKFIDQDKQLRF